MKYFSWCEITSKCHVQQNEIDGEYLEETLPTVFRAGDDVKIRNNKEVVSSLQVGHEEYNDSMTKVYQ